MLRENEVTLGQSLPGRRLRHRDVRQVAPGRQLPLPARRTAASTRFMRHGGGGVGQTPDYWDNAYFDGTLLPQRRPGAGGGLLHRRLLRLRHDGSSGSRSRRASRSSPTSPPTPRTARCTRRRSSRSPTQESSTVRLAELLRHDRQHRLTTSAGCGRFLEDRGTAPRTRSSSSPPTTAPSSGWRGLQRRHARQARAASTTAATGCRSSSTGRQGRLSGGRDVEPDHRPRRRAADADRPVRHPGPRRASGSTGRSHPPAARGQVGGRDWPDRILVTDSQRVKDPIKWRKSAVMTSRWRLINGKELYDIGKDPGQQTDVAGTHPGVVARLAGFYEAWWAELEPTFADETRRSTSATRPRTPPVSRLTTGSRPAPRPGTRPRCARR